MSQQDVWDAGVATINVHKMFDFYLIIASSIECLAESGSRWSLGARLRTKKYGIFLIALIKLFPPFFTSYQGEEAFLTNHFSFLSFNREEATEEESLEEEQGPFVQFLLAILVVLAAIIDLVPAPESLLCRSTAGWSDFFSELTQEATLVAFAYFHFRHRHSMLAPFTFASVLYMPTQGPRIISIVRICLDYVCCDLFCSFQILATAFPIWALVNQRVFFPRKDTTPKMRDAPPSSSQHQQKQQKQSNLSQQRMDQLRMLLLAVPICSAVVTFMMRNDERMLRLHAGICFATVTMLLYFVSITPGR